MRTLLHDIRVLDQLHGIAVRIAAKQGWAARSAQRIVNALLFQNTLGGLEVIDQKSGMPIQTAMLRRYSALVGIGQFNQMKLLRAELQPGARKRQRGTLAGFQSQHAAVKRQRFCRIGNKNADMVNF